MAVAFLSAERSKDPNKQVGACIVDGRQVILGIGYNGFPRGCSDSDLPWAKKARAGGAGGGAGGGGAPGGSGGGGSVGGAAGTGALATKYPYVVHAEANALLNTNHAAGRVEGAVSLCFECFGVGFFCVARRPPPLAHTQTAGRQPTQTQTQKSKPMHEKQRIYVTMFPCNECAKLLIQAGITEVVFHENKPSPQKTAGAAAAAAAGPARVVLAAAADAAADARSADAALARFAAEEDGKADAPDAAAMAARLAGSGEEEEEEEGEREGDGGAAAGAVAAAAPPAGSDDVGGGGGGGGGDQDAHAQRPQHHYPPHMSPEDAVYAASRRLLALAGVRVRQHALVRRIALPPPPPSAAPAPAAAALVAAPPGCKGDRCC